MHYIYQIDGYKNFLKTSGKSQMFVKYFLINPGLCWFIKMALYYIDKNRRRCSAEFYRVFMWSAFKTLKMSKCANYEMLIVAKVMLKRLDK